MDEAAPTRECGSLVGVLISVDMEGVAGVATRQQTIPAGRDYPIARALMTAEANAAVAGAFYGGATSVVVNDSHGPMDNLLGEQLDPRADYVVGDPKPLDMVQEVTPQTGVVLLVGRQGARHRADRHVLGALPGRQSSRGDGRAHRLVHAGQTVSGPLNPGTALKAHTAVCGPQTPQ
jgi:D-aminopeptidase